MVLGLKIDTKEDQHQKALRNFLTLTLFRPGFFYRLKVQGGSLGTPLMISGTIRASPMKLCTVIVLRKVYQNTKRNFQKYDL